MSRNVTIGDACYITTGKLDSNQYSENGKYPFFTCAPIPLKVNTFAFDDDVILIAGNNASGNFHLNRYTGKFNAYQRTYILTPQKGFSIDYIFYSLKLSLKNLKKKSQGSQTKFLTMPLLTSIKLNEICLNDQQRIASVLSSLDDKIELNNRINAELEAMAKTLYDYWFVQFDFPDANGKPYKSSGGKMVYNEELKREIPEGWEVKSLYDIASFTNGLACQKYRPTDENYLRVIKIREMRDGFSDNSEYVSSTIPKSVIINNGDILFSWSASLEVMIWNGGTGGLNQHIFKVTSDKYPKLFVYFQLLDYLAHFKKMAEMRKTTMGHITIDHLKQSRIVVPSIPLIISLNNRLSPIFDKFGLNQQENQHLSSLRDWLLPMLMNGQVGFKEEHQEQVQTVSVAAEAKVDYKPSNPKNDKYHKIQSVYVVLWANSLLGVKQGEMATAKDLYLVDRIAGVHTGFTYAQHSWGSFDPAFKQTINNKYFTKRNFPDSPAHYCDTADNGYLLAKIPEDTKEKVKSSIEELHHKIFKKYFGKQKAEMKELYATVLKCIEDAQSTTFAVIRQTMKDWKTPKQNFPDKAIKFSEQLTKEALDTIIREGWDRNVMRNEG